MNYVGIDIHKRYSVLVALDERGRELKRCRINGNTAFGFAQFFSGLDGKSKVVVEACWNWGRIYDLLLGVEVPLRRVMRDPPPASRGLRCGLLPGRRDRGNLGNAPRSNRIAGPSPAPRYTSSRTRRSGRAGRGYALGSAIASMP